MKKEDSDIFLNLLFLIYFSCYKILIIPIGGFFMIYDIMSKNDVPTSQMHIYLKNKTGDDGGIYPEIFNDLSISESINGLYTFAIACVITDNFTNTTRFLKGYPSKEVATLSLIQYIKGMATTVQLNKQCVNPMYNNLSEINQLGLSPTLLNLDGDLLYKHYDTSKYFSKEAADEAEDSFPYWVINIVKEITNCVEIIKPAAKVYELPYYIQNISNEYIPILSRRGPVTEESTIGKIPPSGTEAVIAIKDGYGVLASSENAYVFLTDKVQPCKHVVEMSELDSDTGTLKLPVGEFDVVCKNNVLINGSYGINNHYFSNEVHMYHGGDTIHIKGLFRNNGIVSDGIYVQLHSDCVYIKNLSEDHTNIEENVPVEEKNVIDFSSPFYDCKYLVIVPVASEEAAQQAIMNILKKSIYKNAYIDIDKDDKVTLVIYGDNDSSEVVKVKKKILAMFGYKANIVETNVFYN